MSRRPKPAAKRAQQTGCVPAIETRAQAAVPAPPAEEEPGGAALARATGSDHAPFSAVLLNGVAATLGLPPHHPQHEQRAAAAFGAMTGVGPQDAVEGMIAGHLAVLNSGALTLLQTAAASGGGDQASRLRRDALACMRVFNESIGALQQWRGKTVRQHLTVERVLVQEGASLAIGAVDGTKDG